MKLVQWIIDWVNHTTPDGWLSLWGSILGFVGIIWTIKHTKKQFNKEKKINVKPFLNVDLINHKENGRSLGLIEINQFKNRNMYEDTKIGLEISNLGLGNCLGCKLIEINKQGRSINEDNIFIGNIKKDSSVVHNIKFIIWYGDILDNYKKKYVGGKIKDFSESYRTLEEEINKSEINRIEIVFLYKDVLDTVYKKSVYLDIGVIFNIKTNDIHYIEDIEFSRIYYRIKENYQKEI
ncbi:hypothetical protein M4I33_10540 [Clostridium sp. LY3-2]|uniref:hypothetical protein n=1 Tax=Clostridium sp. LY3-2 TaxID=2942482 RepID=UPI00215249E2|nr:hypothetical protein [Clostridium sp. LY3-2]MCR6515305.1 hypothetical protein [Clostridium sp. LY3-2]